MTDVPEPSADRRDAPGATSRARALFVEHVGSDGFDRSRYAELRAAHPDLAEELDALADELEAVRGLVELSDASIASHLARTGPDPLPAAGGGPVAAEVVERLRGAATAGRRYERRSSLARGGMGEVVEVWDDQLGRRLAMKVGERVEGDLGPGVARRLTRFVEEAQVTGQLDHPAVVPVHDIGVDEEGRAYFTMRLVEGRNLDEVFAAAESGEAGWTRARVLGVLQRVCEALAYAHSRGVIHRDLKPANVMVGRFGEVYVVDWGLAKVVGGSQDDVATVRQDLRRGPYSPGDTVDGQIVGTPAYMPPEQARGEGGALGPTADVYAVGAILYRFLTGRRPYAHPSQQQTASQVIGLVAREAPVPVRDLAPDAPPELVAICERAMARDPSLRHQDVVELEEDLRAFVEGRVVPSYAHGPVQELRKWVERNRLPAVVSVTALVLVLTALSVALLVQSRAKRRLAEAGDRLATLGALEMVRQDPARALGIALDVADASPSPFARTALYSALHRLRQDRFVAACKRSGFTGDGEYLVGWERESFRVVSWDVVRRRPGPSVELPPGHPLRTVVPGPTAATVACFGSDGRAWLVDLVAGRSDPLVDEGGLAHDGRVWVAGFTPDGALLLTGGRDGIVRTWRVADRTLVARAPAHDGPVNALEIDAGGARAATAVVHQEVGPATDRTVRVIDVATGALVASTGDVGAAITAIAMDRAGARIAVATADARLHLFDARDATPLQAPFRLDEWAFCLDFSPAGDLIAAGLDRGLTILRPSDGLALDTGPTPHEDRAVRHVDFDATGRRLLTTGFDRTVRIWDVDVERATPSFSVRVALLPQRATWSPRGDRIAAAFSDGTRLWHAGPNPFAPILTTSTGAEVAGVTFGSSARTVHALSVDGVLSSWTFEPGVRVRRLGMRDPGLAGSEPVGLVSWPERRALVVVYESGSIGVLDELAPAGPPLRLEQAAPTRRMHFDPDRGVLLLGHDSGVTTLHLGEEPVRREHGTVPAPVEALDLGPDGASIAVALEDGRVGRLVDGAFRELGRLTSTRRFVQPIYDVRFEPGGGGLLSCGAQGLVRWDVERAGEGRTIAEGAMPGPILVPPGSQEVLVPVNWRGELRRIPLGGGEPRAFDLSEVGVTLSSELGVVVLGPRGDLVLGGGRDGTATLFDRGATSARGAFTGHAAAIGAGAFSPDGAWIATGDVEGVVRVWPTDVVEVARAADPGES